MKKLHSMNSVFTHTLTLSFLLAAASFSQAETAAKVAAKPAAAKTIKPASFPPLSAEIKATILSNRTASAQEQIQEMAKLNLTDTQMAQACLLVLPSQKREGQREFARAALRYVTDSTHVLIQQPLIEGKLDKQILSIFMTDTLKRPNRVKLPALLELARTQDNPMQSEAKELLIAFLGKDHGTNWTEWQRTVQASVSSSPN